MKKLYCLAILPSFLCSSAYAGISGDDYFNLPLEELLSMEVTSVAKKKQSLKEVAAAVYVITAEDIRRSGVTSIPEALRMAPGIQVARMDANKWSISSRGFNSQFANKLLVMIDGRTVYTPSYSGVYWDAQDTMMEDIERIEVIRGPGATVWGANAVNGVINVITKNASQTQDGLVVAGVGDEEKSFVNFRYGAELNEDVSGRFYVKHSNKDSSYASGLDDGGDAWDTLRGGFRLDGKVTVKDVWTLQGDLYDSNQNQTVNKWVNPYDPANAAYAPSYLMPNYNDHIDSAGWNLLGKWEHTLSETSNMSLQVYYDYTERKETFVEQFHDTFDIDFQHQFKVMQIHDVVWGLGYRNIKDDFHNTFSVRFIPDNSRVELFSAFIQDEIELIPNTLRLTIGSKFEDNEYTNLEIQPSVRLLWMINERNTVWGSVSKAVRSPSRMDRTGDFVSYVVSFPPGVPLPPAVLKAYGNEDFKSEKLLAYELGYRFNPKENLSFDLAVFYNDYSDLQNYEQQSATVLSNVTFDNNISAHSSGLELSTEWRPLEWWRIQSNYSYITISARLKSTSHDVSQTDEFNEGSTPEHQFSIRSMMDLSHNIALDMWVYYVDELEKTNVTKNTYIPDYTSFNLRVAWKPRKKLELSLVGQNLFDNHHKEFSGENLQIDTQVERSVYGQIRWSF